MGSNAISPAERSLPRQVLEMLRLLPAETHPMDALRTGVSMLAAFDPDLNDNSRDADFRKAVRLIAKVSALIADSWRITHGKEPQPSDPTFKHAGNFLLTLNDNSPETWETEILDTVLILYADHEFNASTFSARVTASTMSDIYSAVTTGIGTLKGPLHGGANEESMRILQEIGSPEHVEAWVKERLARKEKIMGFGHRVYKSGDSRVPVMRELARRLGERTGEIHWVAICEASRTRCGARRVSAPTWTFTFALMEVGDGGISRRHRVCRWACTLPRHIRWTWSSCGLRSGIGTEAEPR